MTGGQTAVIRRVFLGGESVDVAANAIDRLADLSRRTSSGALEQQVLKKVAHTRQMLGFVASPNTHPDAGRDRERTLYFFGGHSETVGQLRDAKSARCR